MPGPAARPSSRGCARSSPSAPCPRPRRGEGATSTRSGRARRSSRCSTCARGGTGPTACCSIPRGSRPDAACALDWHYPSPDGRLLAYGLSEGGDEKSTLRVRDVSAGADLEEAIPVHARLLARMAPRRLGLLLHALSRAGLRARGRENYDRRVFFHHLGTDWRNDPLVFAPQAPEDWPNVHLSPDGRWLAVSVSKGWTRTDVYLKDRASDDSFQPVVVGEDAVFGGRGAQRRSLPPHQPGCAAVPARARHPRAAAREHWRELLPEAEDVLEGVGHLGLKPPRPAAARRVLAPARPRPEGRLVREVALPVLGSVAGLTGGVGRRRGLLRLLVLHLPPGRLPPGASRRGAGRAVAACGGRRGRLGLRHPARALPLAGRHPRLDVPRPPPATGRATGRGRACSPATAASR